MDITKEAKRKEQVWFCKSTLSLYEAHKVTLLQLCGADKVTLLQRPLWIQLVIN